MSMLSNKAIPLTIGTVTSCGITKEKFPHYFLSKEVICFKEKDNLLDYINELQERIEKLQEANIELRKRKWYQLLF